MKIGIIAIILHLTIVLGSLASWGVNLYRFCNCDFEAPYKAEILYGIGIFSPTCVVTAWMDLE
jgi:hypothetical protein